MRETERSLWHSKSVLLAAKLELADELKGLKKILK